MAGSNAAPIAVATGVTSVQITDLTTGFVTPGVGNLMGVAWRETAGGVARFELRQGLLDTSPLVVGIGMAASGSDVKWFGPQGIRYTGGLRLVRPAGTSEIEVFLG